MRSAAGADDGLGVRVVLAALCGGGDAGVRRPLAIVLCVMLFHSSAISAVFYSGPSWRRRAWRTGTWAASS